ARAAGGPLDQLGQRLELAAALQHGVDGGRRPQLERRLRGAYIDDTLVGLDAEAHVAFGAERDEGEPARQRLARRGRGGTRAEPRTQARGGGGGAEDGRLQECATTLVHEGLLWALDYTLRMQGPPREAEGAAAGEKPDGVHPRAHHQHGGGEAQRRREL